MPSTPTAQTALIPPVNQTTEDEKTAKLFKELATQAWPYMLRGAVVTARYTVLSIMLGKLDERLLAPNTLINALESIYIIFGGRSLSIASSIIGELYGEINKINADQTLDEETKAAHRAEKEIKIGATMRHALIVGFALSLPIAGLYYFANHHILNALGQHPFAVEKAKDYFQAAALGYPPLILMTAQQRLLQGIKNPISVLLFNLVHSTIAITTAYIFLFGKLNAPKLEMTGAGYAFAIAGWGTLFLNTLYLKFNKQFAPYKLFSTTDTCSGTDLFYIVKRGIPTGLQFATENIANMINSVFLGLHNLTALSADQMASQTALLLSIANAGLSQAMSVCVSNAKGAKKYPVSRRYGNMGIITGMAFPLLALLTFLALREQFISLFIDTHNPDNQALVKLAGQFLLFECLRQMTTAIQFTTSGALLGIKDTSFTMQTSIGFSLFLNVAILSVMHFACNLNSLSLFASKAIGVGIAATANMGRWVLKSHEMSEDDQAEIANQSLPHRLKRSFGLFCSREQYPQPPETGEQSGLAIV